jgi:hypothetical protein
VLYTYRSHHHSVLLWAHTGKWDLCGIQSPSIIKYLEPLTGDLFTARFADSIFDEEHFPALGGDFKYQKECQEIDWDAQGIPASNPRTTKTELQVQKIIHLQRLANNLPDAFTNYKGVTKSFIPAQNAPERVEIPNKTGATSITKKRGEKYGHSARNNC